MASEKTAVVKAWFEAIRARDDDAAWACMDADVQIDWSRSEGPAGGTYSGHAEGRKLFDEYDEAFEEFWIEPHEFLVTGDQVVVPNTSHFRGRDGLELVARGALVFGVGNGRIVAMTLFQDPAEALAWVGLAE